MSISVEPYRLPSGRIAYESMARDLATKLRSREAELALVPRWVIVLCGLGWWPSILKRLAALLDFPSKGRCFFYGEKQ